MNVVVVGASSSVGEAVVRALADHRVVGTSRRDLDLVDAASIRTFAGRMGNVDALVLLAGILPGKSLAQYDADEAARVVAVNFTGQALLVKEMLPRMRPGSQVLAMSSRTASSGSYDPVYAASKAALEGFIRSMARAGTGVRFNAVAPGLIEGSSMWRAMSPERRALHVRETPTGRLTTLGEVAAIVAEMLGPAWANVNGCVLAVDGGR